MKNGFKETNAIKMQKPEDKPKDEKTSLGWDFRCPQYDQRHSRFVKAGTNYGVGMRQPVGHAGNPKTVVDVLPQSPRSKDMNERY